MIKNMRQRVVVAMSGGVDSSVAAAVLKEAGYEVIGISMHLWDYTEGERYRPGSCCSIEDIYDARRVADALNMPFYVANFEEAFSKSVVGYFMDEYLNGRTPNPCVRCNQDLKFNLLLKKAMELEADYLATGHYARVGYEEERGRFLLYKGMDVKKDQSYFLFSMSQFELKRTLFPLGGLTKDDVRARAGKMGLRVADKRESQEICFIQDGSYKEFISGRVGSSRGEIVDGDDNMLGYHSGIFNYTVGQRRGLGIGGGAPLYVVRVDRERNRVVVGGRDDLYSSALLVKDVNWIAVDGLDCSIAAWTKIRYSKNGSESTIYPRDDGSVVVEFTRPQRAVAPGQAAVFYDGNIVLGGGWIERAIR